MNQAVSKKLRDAWVTKKISYERRIVIQFPEKGSHKKHLTKKACFSTYIIALCLSYIALSWTLIIGHF